MIGKVGGVELAKVQDLLKEVVDDREWWWGNGVSSSAGCNKYFSFEYPDR